MKGKKGLWDTSRSDGAVLQVRVVGVHRRQGCQILDCYPELTEEGFIFVMAAEQPRIHSGDLVMVTYHRDGGQGGQVRWELAKSAS
jgi:hypothetical protein